jgi:hypothetical protein
LPAAIGHAAVYAGSHSGISRRIAGRKLATHFAPLLVVLPTDFSAKSYICEAAIFLK